MFYRDSPNCTWPSVTKPEGGRRMAPYATSPLLHLRITLKSDLRTPVRVLFKSITTGSPTGGAEIGVSCERLNQTFRESLISTLTAVQKTLLPSSRLLLAAQTRHVSVFGMIPNVTRDWQLWCDKACGNWHARVISDGTAVRWLLKRSTLGTVHNLRGSFGRVNGSLVPQDPWARHMRGI
jgi:hypothetical protein